MLIVLDVMVNDAHVMSATLIQCLIIIQKAIIIVMNHGIQSESKSAEFI